MTDTTNHADGPEVLLTTDGVGIDRKRRALDALTRELEDAKALRDHYQKEYEFWYQSDRDHKAAVDAQSARIANLEEALENLVSWVENMGEFDLEDPVWFATVREARAALAPKEAQG